MPENNLLAPFVEKDGLEIHTVNLPLEQIGSNAVQKLLAIMDGKLTYPISSQWINHQYYGL